MSRLTGRQRSELTALARRPGLWRGVEPCQSDADLAFYLRAGLAHHLGEGRGYEITPAGRATLQKDTDNG